MDDLAGAQELDGVVHIRVIAEPEDVVVCEPRLLLGGQILRQMSPVTAMEPADHGKPDAAVG